MHNVKARRLEWEAKLELRTGAVEGATTAKPAKSDTDGFFAWQTKLMQDLESKYAKKAEPAAATNRVRSASNVDETLAPAMPTGMCAGL